MSQDLKFQQLQALVPNVSRETFLRLLAYEALFHKWSKAFNLAAPSTLPELWTRHVLDSAQLVHLKRPSGVWLDLGSGGGLPGIVNAIFMSENQGGMVHLVESNGKKAAFLRAALAETGAAGTVHNCRIEIAQTQITDVNVVTARALASLDELLRLSQKWLSQEAIGLFHKGRDFRNEIKLARDGWQFDLIEHGSAIDRESVVLEIRSLKSLVQGATP